MSNKLYDFLKYAAIVGLPAFATFWAAIGLVWSIPFTDAIVATIVAVNTFLGALLGVSSAKYHKQ